MQTQTQQTNDPRGVSILARSLFRQMREQGYGPDQIVDLSSRLLELVHDDMRADRAPAAAE